MFSTPLRSGSSHLAKRFNQSVFVLNNSSNISQVLNSGIGRSYSDDKCGKNIPQTEGKQVEPWPKNDQLPGWRTDCPSEPQPTNYDPYRIKVPEIVVPPLPPCNAKRSGDVLKMHEHRDEPVLEQTQQEQQQQSNQEELKPKKEEPKSLLEVLKGWWSKPMLEIAKKKGICSEKPPPEDPPGPPPPRKPFPWKQLLAAVTFFALFGTIYKLILWMQEQEKVSEHKAIWRPRRKIKRPYHAKDLPPCVQYLIVGGGAAGWSAYKTIMQNDKTAKVFFISREDTTPYIQPPMSKHMWWNKEPPDSNNLYYLQDGMRKSMFLARCDDFLDAVKFDRMEKGPAVSIASGWCVLRVDADDHVVYVKTMGGEQPIYYERCLLAPGSRAKNITAFKSAPKEVRERVCTLRTLRDLEIAYRKVEAAKNVVVIGAGPLGCELAFSLARRNLLVDQPDHGPLQVVHVCKDKGVLGGIIPEYLGVWASEYLKCEGITFLPKTQVYDAFISKDGRLELTLSNGKSITTDYAFVAVGAEPRVELAESSDLEIDPVHGGFLVNTELSARTHLYVAGDAASFYSQKNDTRMRIAHIDSAEQQGEIAGHNMTGAWKPCNIEPHYWVRVGENLHIEVVGEVGACMPIVGLFKHCSGPEDKDQPQVKVKGYNIPPCFDKKGKEYRYTYHQGMLFYLRDEVVVGFAFINLPAINGREDVATELIRNRSSYKDIEQLAEKLGFQSSECEYQRDDIIGKKSIAFGDTTPKKKYCPVVNKYRDT